MTMLPEIAAFIQIVLIDVSLAGDNALAVGMAASGLPKAERHKAVLLGILAATILRILFAIFAVQLLHLTGLLFAGGLLLMWVAWKMWREIRRKHAVLADPSDGDLPAKKLSMAVIQIMIADISMSLDNVLAVAGVARDHIGVLVAGLCLSVLLMGAASALVARLTARFSWVAYLGIAVVFYTALMMIWEGGEKMVQTY